MKRIFSAFCLLIATSSFAAGSDAANIMMKQAIDSAIAPLEQQYDVPGIAVAITVSGKHHFYNYGIASKATKQPVTNRTLFEVGSLSKTFTATLACYAQVTGKLSLSDAASQDVPVLRGSHFDRISLLNLATHTSGLPLFVPDGIENATQLMDFYRTWRPDHRAGTYRRYSNMGIGLLGIAAASRLNMPFEEAIEHTLLPALGMKHSYLDVPRDEMGAYAQGYTKHDVPVRLHPGILAPQAYGIKTDTADIARFLDANMQLAPVSEPWRRALACTHSGYYKVGSFMQDIVWEAYPYPVSLNTLLAGNSRDVVMNAAKAEPLQPPMPPQSEYLFNKTGSTNGFSAYVAFIPSRKIGVAILANKSYPLEARVRAVYRIITAVERAQSR